MCVDSRAQRIDPARDRNLVPSIAISSVFNLDVIMPGEGKVVHSGNKFQGWRGIGVRTAVLTPTDYTVMQTVSPTRGIEWNVWGELRAHLDVSVPPFESYHAVHCLEGGFNGETPNQKDAAFHPSFLSSFLSPPSRESYLPLRTRN